ncbi:MAG: LacI family transcriptional regulator [Clostridiales bacterium]|nr:LacI family transcriptional regulator [Clostridiales bacterium]
MATSKDVAKLAGVSHTTVSRAFNGQSVKNETYEKIMQAARRLNYRPNTIAASLRGSRTKTVGLILSYAHVALFMSIMQELESQLQKNGYRVLISFDYGDVEKQRNALRTMAGARVDSILFMPASYPRAAAAEELKWMKSANIQFLQIISVCFEELSSFQFDDIGATLNGMRHLFQKGHRRILFLGGSNRLEGFTRAYAELGQDPPVPPNTLEDLTAEECRAEIKALMLRHKPTAVFSISDLVNVAAYGVISELKFRIPEDVSLLIFDEAFWSTSLNISAIAHPVQGMATAIVRQILDHAADGGADQLPAAMTFKPFLVERSSIAENQK